MVEDIEVDQRRIRGIQLAGGLGGYWVGQDGVTLIQTEPRRREDTTTFWFRVWKGERLVARTNALHVMNVEYQDDPK